MGIANTFEFGGINTSTYGLVVEGSGDYSAPKRVVETIEIPGRNGAYQLDKGYYENIEVEYRVVVAEDNHSDFRDTIDDFRNAIVSQTGYQRLTDTYHPGEYRMAMYAGGLDEDPSFIGKGAVFKVKFDCQPQRYLTSGEDEISVDSGDEITNPTLFESKPLLEVEGYGKINVNGETVEIDSSAPIGMVTITDTEGLATGKTKTYTGDFSMLNSGDTIYLNAPSYTREYVYGTGVFIDSSSATAVSNMTYGAYSDHTYVTTDPLRQSFTYGTSATVNGSITIHYDLSNGTTATQTFTLAVAYDGDSTFTITATVTGADPKTVEKEITGFSDMKADSTAPSLGFPLYIDFEIGEAYKIEQGVYISVDHAVSMPAVLPKLKPRANEITFDNTVTGLKIVPRWWKI